MFTIEQFLRSRNTIPNESQNWNFANSFEIKNERKTSSTSDEPFLRS